MIRFSLLINEDVNSPEEIWSLDSMIVSLVTIAILQSVLNSSTRLVTQVAQRWLYVDSCAGTVRLIYSLSEGRKSESRSALW
jgi:hypothetical protein